MGLCRTRAVTEGLVCTGGEGGGTALLLWPQMPAPTTTTENQDLTESSLMSTICKVCLLPRQGLDSSLGKEAKRSGKELAFGDATWQLGPRRQRGPQQGLELLTDWLTTTQNRRTGGAQKSPEVTPALYGSKRDVPHFQMI